MSNEEKEILIRVDTNVKTLLTNDKDKEKRIRFLEKYAYILLGSTIAINFIIGYLFK